MWTIRKKYFFLHFTNVQIYSCYVKYIGFPFNAYFKLSQQTLKKSSNLKINGGRDVKTEMDGGR